MNKFKKLYIISVYAVGILALSHLLYGIKPDATTIQNLPDNAMELSVDGVVKSYHYPAGSTIHIIVDKDQVLTDIQFFPPHGGVITQIKKDG